MAQKLNDTYVGTELKMHIGFSYKDGLVTLSSLPNFIAEFFCEDGRSQRFEKTRNEFIEENGEYYACVDTKVTGPGLLKMKFTAFIDEYKRYGNDYTRTEVAVCSTNVRIHECNDK